MDLKPGYNDKSANPSVGDGEKNLFQKIIIESKQTLFETLILLLKEQEESSFYVAVILSIINFLQFISFAFHSQISALWNFSSIADNIYKVIKYLQLLPYTTDTTFSAYIIIFYVAFSFIVLVVLLFWYIRHAINQKKFTFIWPVHALRILLNLFLTILFVPLFSYFVSVLDCSRNSEGKLVHSLFPAKLCWSGTYFIHGILAILISIVYLALCLVTSLIYFESRPVRAHSMARRSSRPHFLLLIYEAVMILLLTFLKIQESYIIIISAIFIGSAVIFYMFHFESPFFRDRASRLWSSLSAVNLWTAVMLIFSAVMEKNLFQGSIIAWIIGIPFVASIVITDKEYNLDLLLLNSNKFQSGKYIEKQVHYLLRLVSWQSSNNKNASILLDGFIEIHKQTCSKDDCPLKEKNAKSTKISKLFLHRHGETYSEKQTLILHLVYQMLVDGLKLFPNDTKLRITLAFFMLNTMNNKKQALQEFTQAEQSKPLFDEEFIIFRNKRIIEDEIIENQNEEHASLDVISEMNFQNHLRTFQANIEKSSLLHLEFWSQLLEEKPDLSKLDDIGAKVSKSLQSVEEQWNRIQRLGANNAKSMRLYGRFLIEITNDAETGEDLIKKSRNTMNLPSTRRNPNMINFASEHDFINESTPVIFISGEQEKLALITHLNMAASGLFGYNKNELLSFSLILSLS